MVFAHAEGVLHAVERQILVQTELVTAVHHRHAQPGKLVRVERVIVVLVLHALGRQILVQIAHATAVLVQRAPERRTPVLLVLVTVGLIRLAPERRIPVLLTYVTVVLLLRAPQILIPVLLVFVNVTLLMLAQEHRTLVRQVHAYVVQLELPVQLPVKPVLAPHQLVHVDNTINTQFSHTPYP